MTNRCTACGRNLHTSPLEDERLLPEGSECHICSRPITPWGGQAEWTDYGLADSAETWERIQCDQRSADTQNVIDMLANRSTLHGFPRGLARKVSVDGIHDAIWDALPAETLGDIERGIMPARGIGLAGPTRRGKSGALLALARWLYECRLVLRIDPIEIHWVSWPQARFDMDNRSIDSGPWKRQLTSPFASLVVLDDLGDEVSARWPDGNLRPSAEALTAVIRERHDAGVPIWWSTNRYDPKLEDPTESALASLAALYPAPVVARLDELAPVIAFDATMPGYPRT